MNPAESTFVSGQRRGVTCVHHPPSHVDERGCCAPGPPVHDGLRSPLLFFSFFFFVISPSVQLFFSAYPLQLLTNLVASPFSSSRCHYPPLFGGVARACCLPRQGQDPSSLDGGTPPPAARPGLGCACEKASTHDDGVMPWVPELRISLPGWGGSLKSEGEKPRWGAKEPVSVSVSGGGKRHDKSRARVYRADSISGVERY